MAALFCYGSFQTLTLQQTFAVGAPKSCVPHSHLCVSTCRTLLQVFRKRGRLPPVLFLQMDNCSRENKNWIMFAYLSWLVETGVFQKVQVGFMIVGCVVSLCVSFFVPPAMFSKQTAQTPMCHMGDSTRTPPRFVLVNNFFFSNRHTHSYVDQCFSCISRHLEHVKAFTLPALGKACCDAFTGRQGRAEIFYLRETADVKGWLMPFHQHFNNITSSHQYTIERKHVDGIPKAVMSIKLFAASPDESRITLGCMLKVS